ncbi:MAG TPA: hypothetical protein VMT46_05690 [Anaerolineaceae bacterium]|nr:hypothetical protein [Anaerolineaceae bacterium]
MRHIEATTWQDFNAPVTLTSMPASFKGIFAIPVRKSATRWIAPWNASSTVSGE